MIKTITITLILLLDLIIHMYVKGLFTKSTKRKQP